MAIDRQKLMSGVSRSDSNVPLTQFSIPGVDMEKFREYTELPDQFLRFCTLKEGTYIVVLALNSIAATMMGYIGYLHWIVPDDMDEWWQERFRDDFDFYYMDENEELRNKLWPLWRPISLAVVGAKALYFFTGMLVYYALWKKTVHPLWYMPWLIVTGMFIMIMWIMAGMMTVVMFIMLVYRPITVTWDIGPIACVIAYNVLWCYAWFIVIAHYKRRVIVKFWRDKQLSQGSDILGPEELSVGIGNKT